MSNLQTPIVLLVFNRPDLTQKVFSAIRQAKPKQLFIVADGPRNNYPDDGTKCTAVREIVQQVDWDCEVLKNYSDTNLGCKLRVSSGLDWVFGTVETAIILEDDCMPHPTFFRFCEELLDYYRYDERVMVISGNNFQFGHNPTEYSYYFSRYNHCWGWATWRRAWQHYDIEMKLWPLMRDGNWLTQILTRARAVKYWTNIFQNTYDGKINSWAYRWMLACWTQSGLTILPKTNLVSNIGFGLEATHTTNKFKVANIPIQSIDFPIHHPPFVIQNLKADNFTQNNIFSLSLKNQVFNKIKNYFGG